MGGIKHGNWGMMPTNGDQSAWMNAGKGMPKDPIEKHWKHTEMHITNAVVNCMLCGKQIVAADTDEHGFNVDWQKEIQESAHGRCKAEFIRQRMEQNGTKS